MSGAVPQFPSSPNYAMEKMKEIDERTRLENMHTKQKAGTPTRDINLQQLVFQWLMNTLDEMPKGKQDYDKWIQDGKVITKAIQYVKFNSVPIDPTSEFSIKNQASPKPNTKNQENGISTNINNGSATNDSKNKSKSNVTKKGNKHDNAGEYLTQYTYSPEVLESLSRKEVEDRVKLALHHMRKLGIPEEFLFKQEDLIELKHVPRVTRCIAFLAKMSGAKSFENCTIEIPEESNEDAETDSDGLEDIH